jgi:hypothetical protein
MVLARLRPGGSPPAHSATELILGEIMATKPFRLLLGDGETRNYATAQARDENAQRLADETGEWVGAEVRKDGEWWLERVVHPTATR